MRVTDKELAAMLQEASPQYQFIKLECKWCHMQYLECPECYVIVKRVGPHHCCNRWFENQLAINTPPIIGCNNLCRACMIRDGCPHAFREV